MRPNHLETKAKELQCPVIGSNCVGANCMFWSWSDCDPELEKRKADSRAIHNDAKLPKKIIPIKGFCTF